MPVDRFARSRLSAVELEERNRLVVAFHDAGVKLGRCLVCREPVPLSAHHFIEHGFIRRELKNVVGSLRLEALCWDVRNAGGVCDRDHLNHHWSGSRRIFAHHVPDSAWELARELDALTKTEKFSVHLERKYHRQMDVAA